MGQAPYVSNAASLVTFRPGAKVCFVGDSISAAPQCPWFAEVANRLKMLYGDAVTITIHATGGATIEGATSDTNFTAAIADAPDVLIVELGVNNMSAGVSRSSIATKVAARIAQVRAALPNAEMAWLSIWCGHGEALPNPNQADLDAVNGGISDACSAGRVQFVEVNSVSVADDMNNNPTNVNGRNTLDGTHPNWRGRPMMGRAGVDRLRFAYPTGTDVDITPGWTPADDVTPLIWLEADQIAAGAVTTWGPYSVFGGAPQVIPDGWFNGRPCVRFDGIADVLAAPGLSIAAGAKTLFIVYKLITAPSAFATYISACSFTNGVVSSEFMPVNNTPDPAVSWCCDQKRNGSDGFFMTGTSDLTDSSGYMYPTRFASKFAGGTSTDTAQYQHFWGGTSLTSARGTTWLPLELTAKCAIGARISDGVTASHFANMDLAVLGLLPGSLTTQQFYRVDQYLRRKWGP